MVVKWENLLDEIDTTLEAICDFLGEDYQSNILELGGLEEMGFVKEKKYSTKLQKLGQKVPSNSYHLSNNDRILIQSKCSPEMLFFGYNLFTFNRQNSEKLKQITIDYPIYLLGMFLLKPLIIYKYIKRKLSI